MAVQLAECFRAELDMLLVDAPRRSPIGLEELAAGTGATKSLLDRIREARNEATTLSVPLRSYMIKGHDVSDIAQFMDRRGYDLLVVGYAGPASLADRVMGHSADRLIELSPCPVLVIK
jgi:nucleotide-binding universal stress UspA family protein